jgi:hypothetical protein
MEEDVQFIRVCESVSVLKERPGRGVPTKYFLNQNVTVVGMHISGGGNEGRGDFETPPGNWNGRMVLKQ